MESSAGSPSRRMAGASWAAAKCRFPNTLRNWAAMLGNTTEKSNCSASIGASFQLGFSLVAYTGRGFQTVEKPASNTNRIAKKGCKDKVFVEKGGKLSKSGRHGRTEVQSVQNGQQILRFICAILRKIAVTFSGNMV